MSCKECAARRKLARDALFRAKIGEASGHVLKGAAEMVGLKEKTAVAEQEQQVLTSTKRRQKTDNHDSGPAGINPGDTGQENTHE